MSTGNLCFGENCLSLFTPVLLYEPVREKTNNLGSDEV